MANWYRPSSFQLHVRTMCDDKTEKTPVKPHVFAYIVMPESISLVIDFNDLKIYFLGDTLCACNKTALE